jgi:hypothetical protein
VTEQSLYLSTTKASSRWRVQEVYPWTPPGALPLAKTFKYKFVAQTTSLSSSEKLVGAASAADGSAAADKEAATGEPGSGQHNNILICS